MGTGAGKGGVATVEDHHAVVVDVVAESGEGVFVLCGHTFAKSFPRSVVPVHWYGRRCLFYMEPTSVPVVV